MAMTKTSIDTSGVPLAPEQPDVLTPATTMSPSGAMIEPTIVERIDYAHPAVDNNPRLGVPAVSNRIDFNDPNFDQPVDVALAPEPSDKNGKVAE